MTMAKNEMTRHHWQVRVVKTKNIIPDAQEPQQQVRGRPKYPTYQNFKGRKSNSLMNLCGKEHLSSWNIHLYPLLVQLIS